MPSSSQRWKLAKPVWESAPTKVYQSNVLKAIGGWGGTETEKTRPKSITACDVKKLEIQDGMVIYG